MDAWRLKHVADQDTIKLLWKWKCIKLVTLLWYIMIHGQQNVKWIVILKLPAFVIVVEQTSVYTLNSNWSHCTNILLYSFFCSLCNIYSIILIEGLRLLVLCLYNEKLAFLYLFCRRFTCASGVIFKTLNVRCVRQHLWSSFSLNSGLLHIMLGI
jgi:hypothetical protein